MTLLHTRYESGTQITAGAIGTGSIIGVSGINDWTGRINFGGYDFPQAANLTFTTGSFDFIEKVVVSGANHNYETDITYSNYAKPTKMIESGTTIGSVITTSLYYQTGSGLTATGSLSTGSITLS